MTTQTTAPTRPPQPFTPRRGPIIAAGIASATTFLIALAAWRDPAASPLVRAGDGPLLVGFVPPMMVAALAAILALAGTVGATLAQSRPTRVGRSALTGLAASEVVVFGVGFGSVAGISLAGYLVALAMPALLTVVVVQAVRRYRRLRWVAVSLLGLFLAWGLTTAALAPDTLAQLGTGLAAGFAAAGPQLLVTIVIMAATVTWGLVLLGQLRRTTALTRAGAVVLTHRRLLTVTAAVCTLPYGLVRLTWLTPWPLLGPGEQMAADIRLWGLLLGSGSLLGFVLTLGLIRPWGERFPRWIPRLAGRSVPVAAAAAPGGLVATIVCASAAPMLVRLTLTAGGGGVGVNSWTQRLGAAILFPFWLWGPTLALAVWGYVLHRRGVPCAVRS